MERMQRWYEASQHRFSVRKYKAAPNEADLRALAGMAEQLGTRGIRVVLGTSDSVFKPMFLWYGKVSGTNAFAAIIAQKDAAPEMAGYVGEAFILECAAMGLGTCWLGGTYNKKNALSAIALAEGERMVCITPIGVPDEEYTERPRHSIEKLTGLGAEAFAALPAWQKCAVECARRAPSAVNKQPWQFHVQGNSITVENTSENFGYGRLDCGIAMLHIELGAAHCGVSGTWKRVEEGSVFTGA